MGLHLGSRLHTDALIHALSNIVTSPAKPQNWGGNTWGQVASQYDPRHPEGALNIASFLMGPKGEFRLPETATLYANRDLGTTRERGVVERQLAPYARHGEGTSTPKTPSGRPGESVGNALALNAVMQALGRIERRAVTGTSHPALVQLLSDFLRAHKS